MDAGTLIRTSAPTSSRLAGEVMWWIDAEGRVGTGRRRGPEAVLALGRVCPDAMIGVIEQLGGRAAVLGLLPRGVVDLLAARFPGVRWAVADVEPSIMSAGLRAR